MNDLCNHELLEKVATGAATSAETAELEAHTIECATCARELSWQRREHALFAGRSKRDVSELWSNVEARLSAPVVQPRRHTNWTAGLVAAAAGLLLMVKVVPFAMHHGDTPIVVVPAQGAAFPAQVATSPTNVDKSWTQPITDEGRVVISNVSGTISLEMANRADVLVSADHWPDLVHAGWEVKVETTGKDVSVRVECSRSCKEDVDLHVTLPRSSKAKVVVDSVSADVELEHITAPVLVHTVSGEVHAERSNLVEVETTSGDIEVESADSTAQKLVTVSGEINWVGLCSKGCALSMKSVSGDIQVEPQHGSSFRAKVQAGQIRRTRDEPNAAGEIHVTTVSGEVEIPDVIHASDEDDGDGDKDSDD